MPQNISRGASELSQLVTQAYQRGIDDYHMVPLRPNPHEGSIGDGDSVIFCCRRGEREIELTEFFTDKEFTAIPRHLLSNLTFVPLTLYHEKFEKLPVAFPPVHVHTPLAGVLSDAGKTQLHLAESEKFAHVTFFFNGGVNEAFPGEEDLCIPSPKEIPFEKVPELSLSQVSDTLCKKLCLYDFVVVNFANGDVIGHTSDDMAKLKACEHISTHLEKVVTKAIDAGYVILVTADHGNIETLHTPSGKPHVAHTTNQVLCTVIDGNKPEASISLHDGSLRDVAPTILQIMGLDKPDCMTGSSLANGYQFGKDRKVLLVILDGWGIGSKDGNDAITLAKTPYWDFFSTHYPSCKLDASGQAVGLAGGKPGNSEAGHMNLGAGRCVEQDDVRIDRALENGDFARNPVFLNAITKARDSGKNLHLLTFLTYASSHGNMNYAVKLCEMAKKLGMDRVFLHIIFDGRSTDPESAPTLLGALESRLDEIGIGKMVDGIGRGLILDRDKNYQHVKLGYDMMLGRGN